VARFPANRKRGSPGKLAKKRDDSVMTPLFAPTRTADQSVIAKRVEGTLAANTRRSSRQQRNPEMSFQHDPKYPRVVNPLSEARDRRGVKKVPSVAHGDAAEPGT
jgi:hypothetical protein